MTELVTAVIGAGPAGLLFCIASKLLWSNEGGDPGSWSILLFDKRTDYQRTHRLRMAPEPVRALQLAVDDPRFDEVVAFLDDCHFSPSVNLLEQQLSKTAAALGVTKQLLDVGPDPAQVAVWLLRSHLLQSGQLRDTAQLTIVGADSVHSEVREAVRGNRAPVDRTHQTVARLRVAGDGLPHRIGKLDTYRLSKVLGSVVDYRLNRNGFAEVDVFLDGADHHRLEAIGARPAAPVPLDDDLVDSVGSPLFTRLVRHLRHGLVDDQCDVALQSTFRLEHQYMEQLTFAPDGVPVFLVGDAAVSLPFFRGMACLTGCVHELALAHCDLAKGSDIVAVRERYERNAGQVREAELATVRSRARLVRGAREFARVSSLLPFPLQTWFLSIPDQRRPGRLTAGVVLGGLLAVVAGALTLSAMAFTSEGIVPGGLWWAGLFVEAIGGLSYRAAQEFEPGPDASLRAVWRIQIAWVFFAGVVVAILRWSSLGWFLRGVALTSWFLLGASFVAGMYAYETVGRRLFARARLGDEP